MSRPVDRSAVAEGVNAIRIHFEQDEPPALVFNESAHPSALVSWAWSQLSALDTLISTLAIDSCGDGSPSDVAASVCCVLGPVINALRYSEVRAHELRRAAGMPGASQKRKRVGKKTQLQKMQPVADN